MDNGLRDQDDQAIELLHQLLEDGVQLRAEGTSLVWKAARGALEPAQKEALVRYKPQLLELLEPGFTYLPLLPSQRRMWLLCQLEPDNAVWNMPCRVDIKGPLDVTALSHALGETSRRFEIIRIKFPKFAFRPVQAIASEQSVEEAPLPVEDLSSLSSEEKLRRLDDITARWSAQPFDLEKGSLFRAALVRLDEHNHRLLFNVHHILCDRWGLRLFLRDFGICYRAFQASETPRLPGITPFSEYALWHQRWLQSEASGQQVAYWQERLAGIDTPAQITPDHERGPDRLLRGDTVTLRLPREQTTALQNLAQASGTSLFTVLLATYALALRGYDPQGTLSIGTAVANRNVPASRRVIGMLANTMVLRLVNPENLDYTSWLRRVDEQLQADFTNQNIPYDLLLEYLPGLNTTEKYADVSSRLFQSFFVMQNISMQRWELAGADIALRQSQDLTHSAKFDLCISVFDDEDNAGGLRLAFNYRAELFEKQTIVDLSAHYHRLIEAILAKPDIATDELPAAPARITVPPRQGDTLVGHESGPDSPQNEVEGKLQAIWQRLLDTPHVGVRDNFFDLGGHSMLAVRMLDEIEADFGRRISLAALFQAQTIRAQARLLEDNTANASEVEISPSTVAFRRQGRYLPLFCIEGVARYRELAKHLGDEHPVYGLFHPQQISQETEEIEGVWRNPRNVMALCTHYVREVRAIQPQGPYFLAGLSRGGLEACIMAHLLRLQGQKVPFIAMFDTYGPNYMLMSKRKRLATHYHTLRNMDRRARQRYFADRVRIRLSKLNRRNRRDLVIETTAEDEEIMKQGLSSRRALAQYLRQNRGHLQFAGHLLLFVALEKELEFLNTDPNMGWDGYAKDIAIERVPGDHLTLLQEPNITRITEVLRPRLREIQEREGALA